MALQAVGLLLVLTFTPAFALRGDVRGDTGTGSLERARAEAAQAVEAARQAVARARAAQQRVRDLGGAEDPDRPFWFADLFPDQDRDDQYRASPYAIGNTPMDDLGILYAAIKETRPKNMVEIGFWAGDGTRALLSAADAGTTCHSFDPRPRPGSVDKLKSQMPGTGRNFVFHEKGGEEITLEDVGGEKVGFAFMDAAHNLTSNMIMFHKLLPLLADDAIVGVHDTGGWSKKFVDQHQDDPTFNWMWHTMEEDVKRDYPPSFWPLQTHGKGDEEYYVHPHVDSERKFVNWVTDKFPEWGTINFHSLNTFRMGVTLMQRQRKLDVNP